MKKIILCLFVLSISVMGKNAAFDKREGNIQKSGLKEKSEIKNQKSKIKNQKSEWDVFVEALIQVESEGNKNAVGKANDVGILQLTPVYVKECNRLSTDKQWKLSERLLPEKSLEMFEFMNSVKNPEHNIYKAIKIHNPNAPQSYTNKVLVAMKKIINNKIEKS